MYAAFVGFIDDDSRLWTWHTPHDNDADRFYLRLHQALEEDNFSPDEMGEHFRARLRNDDGEINEQLEQVVAELVSRAWAVKDYLRATRHLA